MLLHWLWKHQMCLGLLLISSLWRSLASYAFLVSPNEEHGYFGNLAFKQLRCKAQNLIFLGGKKTKPAWAFGWLVLASFSLPLHHLSAIKFSLEMWCVCVSFMDCSWNISEKPWCLNHVGHLEIFLRIRNLNLCRWKVFLLSRMKNQN